VRKCILGAQSDLHAADARYHRKYSAAFHVSTQRTNDTDSKSAADDQAFTETVMVLSSDPSKVWNSLDVEAVYSDQGGRDMCRCTVVEKVIQHFGDEMLPLHSPGDLKKMSGSEEVVQMTHKEESPSRIIRDGDDRQSLRRTLLSCINPMDPDTM